MVPLCAFSCGAGEDSETNPGVLGRQLAQRFAGELRDRGYFDAEEVAEYWGWAVVCSGKPFYLFVACGNVLEEIDDNGPKCVPDNQIVWHAHATANAPLFARLRKIDMAGPVTALDVQLHEILRSATDIRPVDEQ